MNFPTPQLPADAVRYICRDVTVGGRSVGLSIVAVNPDGTLAAIMPFNRETPSTIYFDGRIEVRDGRVTLFPR